MLILSGASYFDGDVGIGTTGPSAKLHISTGATYEVGSLSGSILIEPTGVAFDGYGAGIVLGAGRGGRASGGAAIASVLDSASDPDRSGLSFFYHNATFGDPRTEGMRLAADGNVGIGTTSPQTKLEVNGGLVKIVENSNIAFYGGDYVRVFGTQSYGFRNSGGSTIAQISLTGNSYFNGGNVGIGITNPSALLDVRDGTTSGAIARFSAINAHVVIESSTAGNAVLHLKPNATGSKFGQFKVTAGNGYGFSWSNDAAGTGETTYMDLDTSSTGGGDLTVKGDVIAYGSPSDKKYKENIKPIESALGKAMQLQGVTFDWKDSDSILDIKEDIGFIAQDVQEVLPELVRDSGKGNLSLRYQGITPILLEAIKELKAEIDLLKSKPCNCNNCNCNI